MQVRVGILGGTGYTALELIKLLLRHGGASIEAVTSRQERAAMGAVHPSLAGRLELKLEDPDPAELAKRCECVFSCLPHCASASIAPSLLAAGLKVIDLSADYRLDSPESFRTWYGEEHPDATRLGATPYGLPELFGESIRGASLIANPGCYPTSAILPLAPFLKQDRIETSDIIVDSKSGVSGAGRTPKLNTLFPECNESLAAYGVGQHRHQPEIEQVLGRFAGRTPDVVFTPHLAPMDRGIFSAIYAKPKSSLSAAEAMGTLRAFYAEKPFVRVVDHLPATKFVSHTNFVDITARVVKGRLVLLSCIDNLIKGASGAALQNFNLLYGFEETRGLL